MPIPGAEGVKWARALAQKEGIFTGISGGSTFAVAMQVAEKAAAGSVILCMLPDTGERYLTTPLFEGIVEDMDAEELKISKSTPGYQMPGLTNWTHSSGMPSARNCSAMRSSVRGENTIASRNFRMVKLGWDARKTWRSILSPLRRGPRRTAPPPDYDGSRWRWAAPAGRE